MDNPKLDKIVTKYPKNIKQNKLFLILCYISALIFGLLSVLVIILGSSIWGNGILFYFFTFFILGCTALLTYFSFNNFHPKEKSLLMLLLPLSLLVSAAAFLFHIIFRDIIREIGPNLGQPGGFSDMLSLFGEPINIISLVVLILLAYNLLPVIFLIKEKYFVH